MSEFRVNRDKSAFKKQIVFSTIILGIIGLIVRIPGFSHIGGDMVECLIPWYDSIAPVNGIYSLRNYTGNYGMPYVTILWFLHFIPGQTHIKIKTVSVLFEFIASIAAGLLSAHFYEDKKKNIAFIFGFALTLFYPPLILNGAVQGQCDGIYVSFVLLTVYFLFKGKPSIAFILLGCAFAFKLQTIFILPFLILWYVKKRNFSILHLFLTPITVEILYLPAIIAGYSPLSPITAYIEQAGYYPQMYMYYPNLWCFFWRWAEYSIFNIPVIGWVITLYALIFLLILGSKTIQDKDWLQIALLTSFIAVYFMPAIHERYGLITELLIICYSIIHPKRCWIYIFVCITQTWNLCQFYVFSRWPDGKLTAMGMLILLMIISLFTVNDVSMETITLSGSIKSRISKIEQKVLNILDKYAYIFVWLIAVAILVYSRKNFIRLSTPDYLSDLIITETNYHTGSYMLFIKMLSLIGEKIGKETYFLLKISCLCFDIAAAGIWTYIVSRKIASTFKPSFALAYILIPSTAFYSAIGGRIDGLCLTLIGMGYLVIEKNKPHPFISGLVMGLALSLSPTYLLLIIGLAINEEAISFQKIIRPDYIASAALVILISPLASLMIDGSIIGFYLSYLKSYKINGSIIIPICTLMLIYTYKNRKFLPAFLILESIVLINFGLYMNVLESVL